MQLEGFRSLDRVRLVETRAQPAFHVAPALQVDISLRNGCLTLMILVLALGSVEVEVTLLGRKRARTLQTIQLIQNLLYRC